MEGKHLAGVVASLLLIGWGGQIFYLGFATENLTAYQLLLFGLALMPTVAAEKPAPVRQPHFGFDPAAPEPELVGWSAARSDPAFDRSPR